MTAFKETAVYVCVWRRFQKKNFKKSGFFFYRFLVIALGTPKGLVSPCRGLSRPRYPDQVREKPEEKSSCVFQNNSETVKVSQKKSEILTSDVFAEKTFEKNRKTKNSEEENPRFPKT